MRPRVLATFGIAALVALCALGFGVVAFLDTRESNDPSTQVGRQTGPDSDLAPTGRQPIDLMRVDEGSPVAMSSAIDVVEKVKNTVVTVITRTSSRITGGAVVVSTGTGFVVDRNGYIVTNAHVVAGGVSYLVVFADGSEAEAELVGADPISDLAVIRVAVAVPAVAPLGDSAALRPGQPVLAIGSPLGQFTNTVTEGVVSATGRSISEEPGSPELTGLVQHDAAINPGNSGGPLVNFAGEVVGVNTLGIQETEDGQPAQGLFFAIPSNTVRDIASRLIEDGRVEYPYLGVQTVSITADVAGRNNLPVDYGEYVIDVVEDGPADDAGIRDGDVLLSIDGERINWERTFSEVLFAHAAGERVAVEILRDGEQIEVTVVLKREEQQRRR